MADSARTLVIDTSYGSAVGIVGYDPIIETDSRTHVERLQGNIARAVAEAGLRPHDMDTVVVGIGPAPFTGLRAGIVAAKTIAYATGATLIGQDILAPQHALAALLRDGSIAAPEGLRVVTPPQGDDVRLTLAVNDARRRQLYAALYADAADGGQGVRTLIDMDIDYPDHIAERVNDAVADLHDALPGRRIVVDIIGHGAGKYASSWDGIDAVGVIGDVTPFDFGADGLALFARYAAAEHAGGAERPVEPLYLRRPDVSVPKPLKQVLHHGGAERGV
ncbi:MAG TPA: tRNA (adenosine(37)-N6)-threonylcarbamoyltransferase complex dimerization subunit type 1 TsaB [Bifidobacterium pullorum]|nr:tRNA (adenosine(37)-N6)-threonylcarbamoyltransferase complex dimerization subunit type 1 TsaB [Bifidobacterium pullorum]